LNPFTTRRTVQRTPDFVRIKELPVRAPVDRAALTLEMTNALKRTDGCPGKTSTRGLCDVCGVPVELRDVQALALYELMIVRGLAGIMGVGTGKTLVFLLAPVVLDLKRALGILPASLIDKTEKERARYAMHWKVDRSMQLFSFEALGRVNAATLLETKMPDGVITDESHREKNLKAALVRRLARWRRENPGCPFVSMSGTYMGKSLLDMAHLLRWSLGPENAPVPQTEGETKEWADCLDERVNPLQRVRPGALLELGDGGDGDELSRARRAFHNRLVSTRGVVCSLNDEQVNCSIYIDGSTYEVNEATEKNFDTLRNLWETPDGWALSEAVDVWRHARELAIGMHYVWDPRPPDEWLEARRAWAKFVRDTLAKSRTLDSEKQVADVCVAIEARDFDVDHLRGDTKWQAGVKIYRAWKDIEKTFVIHSKAIWHDDSVLQLCEKWLEKEKGICWVEHTFFGRELARRTGLPYFGQSGLDADGNSLVELALKIDRGEAKAGPIIASVAANGTGKNLQAWHKNLIVSCPTGASVWEQLLGRTHRQGQKADEVQVDVLVGCIEHLDAWKRARAEAQMASDMLGAPQKILIADVSGLDEDDASGYGARWTKGVGPGD
jgi:hypothetical protein